MNLIRILAAVVVLGGCASKPRAPVDPAFIEGLRPPASAIRVCASPIPAQREMTDDWKYGCFCGKGHPALSDVTLKGHSREQREDLAKRYLAIKPIDDVDRACQTHDVCWIMNGDGHVDCNKAFEDRLDAIRKSLKARQEGVNSTEFRCSSMALDMSFASLGFMEDDPDSDPPAALGRWLARVFVGYPLSLIYATAYLVRGAAGQKYPSPSERCFEKGPW